MTRAPGSGEGSSPALTTMPDRVTATLVPDSHGASAATTRSAARFNMLVLYTRVYPETSYTVRISPAHAATKGARLPQAAGGPLDGAPPRLAYPHTEEFRTIDA